MERSLGRGGAWILGLSVVTDLLLPGWENRNFAQRHLRQSGMVLLPNIRLSLPI